MYIRRNIAMKRSASPCEKCTNTAPKDDGKEGLSSSDEFGFHRVYPWLDEIQLIVDLAEHGCEID